MKKTINIFILLFVFISFIKAQELAGRKIISGGVGLQYQKLEVLTQKSWATNANLLYGKIKSNNTYLALGGGISANGGDNLTFLFVGPAVEYGKFVKIIDKLYISPYIGANLQAAFGLNNGVKFNAYASPFRFMYALTDKFMLNATFGSAGLNYSKIKRDTNLDLNASLSNNSSFGIFYTFK